MNIWSALVAIIAMCFFALIVFMLKNPSCPVPIEPGKHAVAPANDEGPVAVLKITPPPKSSERMKDIKPLMAPGSMTTLEEELPAITYEPPADLAPAPDYNPLQALGEKTMGELLSHEPIK